MSTIVPLFINAKRSINRPCGVDEVFFDRYNLDVHNPHNSTLTPHAHTRVRVCTHTKNRLGGSIASSVPQTCSITKRAKQIGRLSSLKCARNMQYHQTRTCTCTLIFLQKFQKKKYDTRFEPWWVASRWTAPPLEHMY